MLTTAPRSASWAEHICHPVALAAVAVLAANDHLLKGSGLLPGALTGKLSDVAGLFFFPLLLSAAIRGGRLLLMAMTAITPVLRWPPSWQRPRPSRR